MTGVGLFPFDMLRHDSCHPAHEHDSSVIEATTRHAGARAGHIVTLTGSKPPTEGRWQSFGWSVMP